MATGYLGSGLLDGLYKKLTIDVAVDASSPVGKRVRVNKFALARRINAAVVSHLVDTYDLDAAFGAVCDVVLLGDVAGIPAAVRFSFRPHATIRIKAVFDPADCGASADEPVRRSAVESLALIVENEFDRAWEAHRIDRLVDDLSAMGEAARNILLWDGANVIALLDPIATLERIAVRYDRLVSCPWEFLVEELPLPEGRRPGGMALPRECIAYDRSGRTLVINDFGQLVTGPDLSSIIVSGQGPEELAA